MERFDMQKIFRCGILLILAGGLLLSAGGCPSPTTTLKDGATLEQLIRARLGEPRAPLATCRRTDGFFGMAVAVPASVARTMRQTGSWRAGCPVPITDLAYLLLTCRGFDGRPYIGELVVHEKIADRVLAAFADLHAQGFPIERMELIDAYDADDDRSMAANNTSAFNCRDITGRPGVWSRHSHGGAIDINPRQNPYVTVKKKALTRAGWDGREDRAAFLRRLGFEAPAPVDAYCRQHPADCLVLPPAATACMDRQQPTPGLLPTGSAAVSAFTERGFEWGGDWSRLLDYQHFEYVTDGLSEKP
jgi:hypothetical protein